MACSAAQHAKLIGSGSMLSQKNFEKFCANYGNFSDILTLVESSYWPIN